MVQKFYVTYNQVRYIMLCAVARPPPPRIHLYHVKSDQDEDQDQWELPYWEGLSRGLELTWKLLRTNANRFCSTQSRFTSSAKDPQMLS